MDLSSLSSKRAWSVVSFYCECVCFVHGSSDLSVRLGLGARKRSRIALREPLADEVGVSLFDWSN